MTARKFFSVAIALLSLSVLAAIGGENETYLHFSGKSGPSQGKRIVLIAGDEEYRSEESLPMLAKILSQRHGFDCTVLFSLDPTGAYIDPNNQKSVTHPEAIAKADLIIIQTRWRQWSPEQYKYLADYLDAGKPIIGLRTATHAFTGSGKTGDFKWADFGLKILGEQWVNHHGHHKVEGTRGVIEQANANHPILNGVKDVFALSDVYTVANLDEKAATVLMRGAVTATLDPNSKPIDGPKNNPMMPVAWVREYTSPNGAAKGKAFCTTMGGSVDFKNEDLRRMIINAAYYLCGLPVPAKADVALVDPYEPTMFGFNNAPDFYKNRNLKVSDLALGRSASTGEGKPKR
jgi:type 1 glutamine amidotransferase